MLLSIEKDSRIASEGALGEQGDAPGGCKGSSESIMVAWAFSKGVSLEGPELSVSYPAIATGIIEPNVWKYFCLA